MRVPRERERERERCVSFFLTRDQSQRCSRDLTQALSATVVGPPPDVPREVSKLSTPRLQSVLWREEDYKRRKLREGALLRTFASQEMRNYYSDKDKMKLEAAQTWTMQTVFSLCNCCCLVIFTALPQRPK